MTDKSREAFEAWHADNGGPIRMHASYPPGYVEDAEEAANWEGWQAATAAQSARVRQLEDALRSVLSYAEAQGCAHDDLYRGGVLWTICRTCDARWADDEGGFKPDKEHPSITRARAALKETP